MIKKEENNRIDVLFNGEGGINETIESLKNILDTIESRSRNITDEDGYMAAFYWRICKALEYNHELQIGVKHLNFLFSDIEMIMQDRTEEISKVWF
jgi:hypothetical protein